MIWSIHYFFTFRFLPDSWQSSSSPSSDLHHAQLSLKYSCHQQLKLLHPPTWHLPTSSAQARSMSLETSMGYRPRTSPKVQLFPHTPTPHILHTFTKSSKYFSEKKIRRKSRKNYMWQPAYVKINAKLKTLNRNFFIVEAFLPFEYFADDNVQWHNSE